MTNAVSATLLADNEDHRFQSNEIRTDLQLVDCLLVVTCFAVHTGHQCRPSKDMNRSQPWYDKLTKPKNKA